MISRQPMALPLPLYGTETSVRLHFSGSFLVILVYVGCRKESAIARSPLRCPIFSPGHRNRMRIVYVSYLHPAVAPGGDRAIADAPCEASARRPCGDVETSASLALPQTVGVDERCDRRYLLPLRSANCLRLHLLFNELELDPRVVQGPDVYADQLVLLTSVGTLPLKLLGNLPSSADLHFNLSNPLLNRVQLSLPIVHSDPPRRYQIAAPPPRSKSDAAPQDNPSKPKFNVIGLCVAL